MNKLLAAVIIWLENSTYSYNNGVVFVEVTQPVGSTGSQTSYDRVLEGTVSASVSNNVLTLASSGQMYALSLKGGAFVYRNEALTNTSALQVGDVVTTYSYNNSVAVVEVTQPVVQPTNTTGDMTGTVTAPVSNNLLIITGGGQTFSLTLNTNAFIYRNGVQTMAAAVQTGDVITVHYYNGVVLYAEVSQLAGGSASPLPTISQISGTVVTAANNVLVLVSGTQTIALTLNANAFITRAGVQVSASSLQAGDVITVRSYNNNVIYAEVTQLSNGSSQSFSVSGTYNGMTLNNQGQIATISINQTGSNGSVVTTVYSVSSSVTINGNMSNLVQNHAIFLQGTGQLVNTITIQ
jgi:hypothetical protein